MFGEVGGLDCARFVEQVAGVVQKSEVPTVDVVPVLPALVVSALALAASFFVGHVHTRIPAVARIV